MTLNVAMPIAHITGTATYADWYANNQCIFEVANYFNKNGAKGISLRTSSAGAAATNAALWNLYAFTDGFLSYSDQSLVLRLPRELKDDEWNKWNSGNLFMPLQPYGPQLANVVYSFSSAPSQAAVRDKIRAILDDATSPTRHLCVDAPGIGEATVGEHIAASAANVDTLLQSFMDGQSQLLVRAGDVIGNFQGQTIEIRFLDSSGSIVPTVVGGAAVMPKGRPLNPSYFLYLVLKNSASVKVLTRRNITPKPPLEFLFDAANIPATGNDDQTLDVAATHPPKPLHATIDVKNAAGTKIADDGISIGSLGEWHQTRNAPAVGGSATKTFDAPIEWRFKGTDAGDTVAADYGKFVSRTKGSSAGLLPSGIDQTYTPQANSTHVTRVQAYWTRYAAIFNAVAKAFEIPCELLIMLSCQETGSWFANSQDTDVIALEDFPMKTKTDRYTAAEVAATVNNADLSKLTAYASLVTTRNFYIPVPWNGNAKLGTSTLTWSDLAALIQTYADVTLPNKSHQAFIKVSPGMIQTLVSTAKSDLTWAGTIYGTGYVQSIKFHDATDNVDITADAPPSTLSALFSDWFGVSVKVANVVNARQSRLKRALHNLIAGACHVKHSYNYSTGGKSPKNFISDFDLPTVASAYNDGAVPVAAALAGSSNDDKWKKLFALTFWDSGYPKNGPLYFNAAVNYFNTGNPDPKPAFRLWRP